MEQHHNIYLDIRKRTNGEFYIGVIGPVRTGKSTLIARFMNEMVLPYMTDDYEKERARDEIPQSGNGRTIMTTQPAFVPSNAATLTLAPEAQIKVRMVDCVGFMIPGALDSMQDEERLIQTPWQEEPISFSQAAKIGTEKVISQHATLSILVTTDGSITEIPRSSYVQAEEETIDCLKRSGKPYIILLNVKDPQNADTQQLRSMLSEKYKTDVLCMNVENSTQQELEMILQKILYAFPISSLQIALPAWMQALPYDHALLEELIDRIRSSLPCVQSMQDAQSFARSFITEHVQNGLLIRNIGLDSGIVEMDCPIEENLFYEVLGEACGTQIHSQAHLMHLMAELVENKHKYDHVAQALEQVYLTGYGLVPPLQEELTLEKPQIVKSGGSYGVRLKASAPSLHFMRVDIQTEVTPIVGTEKQGEEMVNRLLQQFQDEPDKLWQTDIFGTSLSELVREGLSGKLMRMPDEVRNKLQIALQKIINNGSGNLICILL